MGTAKRAGEPAVLVWRSEGRRAIAEYYDENSCRHRVTLGWDLSEDDAEAELKKFNEAQRAVKAQQASYTVGMLWKMWLQEREEDGFSNEIYEKNWVSLEPEFGHRYPAHLKAKDFRKYARDRFALGRASSTVHTELARLRSCLKWAHDTRLIPILVKVWLPSPGKGRKRVLTIDEGKKLVAAALEGDPHVYVFVVLLFATGARHTAILELTWDRVDFDKGTIQYDEDIPRNPMDKSYRKGRATVPMNRTAREALTTAKAGRQTDYVIEHGGKPLKECREGFANAVARAKLDGPHPDGKITPHIIRHTVATWLDAKKIADKRAAQLLGHRDEETTKQVYTHASPDVLIEAVEALDVAFAPLPQITALEVIEGGASTDHSADVGTTCQNEEEGSKTANL